LGLTLAARFRGEAAHSAELEWEWEEDEWVNGGGVGGGAVRMADMAGVEICYKLYVGWVSDIGKDLIDSSIAGRRRVVKRSYSKLRDRVR
jgi:hypothetical protein